MFLHGLFYILTGSSIPFFPQVFYDSSIFFIQSIISFLKIFIQFLNVIFNLQLFKNSNYIPLIVQYIWQSNTQCILLCYLSL